MDKSVRVKFNGGREVVGILKGHDPLLNLVLDEAKEYNPDPEDPFRLLDTTRDLGLVVCRGTAVILICPTDGMMETENPFFEEGDEE
ncbi:U6 snRNA-associated Sm-like protein LSm7 [Sphaeroforma arctica JP610]|uniref:U6 snRNA-associated Sm-like protein LSm7 n=1 Tax=Sphaeroforma arctica JP610 TaxID=667725 RepID=A0A0L0FPY9_9EUKA|nr:U6 snRNA-associated Sm-like protein LSm7 [Sphaeroforma arctica JP610]KNC78784.1 U6 snRNA-associated Sm-like protein LSm7 [Sphaeroforma arctica JP610]|eukprot:XP_014152686.1 U6 snRNA-associated Sm-like protein LSm7 [Sphaeroforma arctica JP610]